MKHHESAVKKLKKHLSRNGADALIVSSEADIKYIANFYTPGALLIVFSKGAPVYLIDRMNFSLGKKYLKNSKVNIVRAEGSIIREAAIIFVDKKLKKVMLDKDVMIVNAYEGLKRLAPKIKLLNALSCVREIRKIKTLEEISILRKAAKETVKIWRIVGKEIKIGMTEREIACIVDTIIREKGYENSFTTIAAIGENSGYPHAIAGNRKLRETEHITLDFGIRYKGYCSDLTRTYYKGRIDRQIKAFRESVLRAQDLAIRNIKPGVQICSIINKVNNILINDGFGEFILHGLGHGVGLEIHEKPFVGGNSKERFKQNMVVTVEPGLYKEGFGGIREEDMILIKKNGCEVLTK